MSLVQGQTDRLMINRPNSTFKPYGLHPVMSGKRIRELSFHYRISTRLISVLILIGLIGSIFIPFALTLNLIDYEMLYFLILPLFWVDISLYAFLGWYRGFRKKPEFNFISFQMSVAAGLISIVCMLISGWMLGVGNSPYNHQFPYSIGYIVYLLSRVIGLEAARGYLLTYWSKWSHTAAFFIIVFFFTFLAIPHGLFRHLLQGSFTIPTIGATILPKLSQSLLLTFLVSVGGPWMAIIYSMFPLAFELFSPILPALNWLQYAFVNTLVPIGIILVINLFLNVCNRKTSIKKREPSYSWFILTFVGVCLLWINTGLFGIQTFLISGTSMEPNYQEGDIVIIKDCDPDQIKIGDIILFNDSSNFVMHRVIGILDSAEDLEFITKGDANNVLDKPISGEAVKGKAVYRIPKIGWIPLNLKRIMTWIN